jgi:hypothetical protein
MSDRLALVHAIEEAGLPREKAEVMATAIARFVEGSVATKAEVERTEAALKADTERLRADLKADIAALRSDMARMQDRIVIRLSGVMVVLLGILFAALKWHS